MNTNTYFANSSKKVVLARIFQGINLKNLFLEKFRANTTDAYGTLTV